MSTYYNRHKTAITDRDQVAAVERLLEVCEASGVFTENYDASAIWVDGTEE